MRRRCQSTHVCACVADMNNSTGTTGSSTTTSNQNYTCTSTNNVCTCTCTNTMMKCLYLYKYLLFNTFTRSISSVLLLLENKRQYFYKQKHCEQQQRQRNNSRIRIRYNKYDSWHGRVMEFFVLILLVLCVVSFNSSSSIIDAALFGPKSILSSRIQYFRGKHQQQQQQQRQHHKAATNTILNRQNSLHPSTKTSPKLTKAAYTCTTTTLSSYNKNDDTNDENEKQLLIQQDVENSVEIQQDETINNLESTLEINTLVSTSTSTSTSTSESTILPTTGSIQSFRVVEQNRNQLLVLDKNLIQQEQQQNKQQQSSSISISTPVVILLSSISLLLIVCSMAIMGIIPGNDTTTLYTTNQIVQDCCMTIVTAILGYIFVKFNTTLVKYNILQPRDARKIIHTFSAPLFIVLWPFFTTTMSSRLFAVIVPTVNTIRLYLAAQTQTTTTTTTTISSSSATSSTVATTTSTSTSGINTDDEINITKQQQQQQQQGFNDSTSTTVDTNTNTDDDELAIAISRSGDVKEALGGPFIYVIMMIMNVLLFWKVSPVAIISLCCMAAGDGLADIIGRRYGKYTMKWTIFDKHTKKTVAGTIAFFVASTISSILLLLWLQYFHCISWSDQFSIVQESIDSTTTAGVASLDWINIGIRVTIISFITSILEVVPAKGFDDNYTVPIAAAILSLLLF